MFLITTKDQPATPEQIQQAMVVLEYIGQVDGQPTFKVVKRRNGEAGKLIQRRGAINIVAQTIDAFLLTRDN